MTSCKRCIHQPICGKQYLRKSLEPDGFELTCNFFERKNNSTKELVDLLIQCEKQFCGHDVSEEFSPSCSINELAMWLFAHGVTVKEVK